MMMNHHWIIHSHSRFMLLGASRKLLGMTFQGETRDTDGMVWGDVEIEGLTTDVRKFKGKRVLPNGKICSIGISGASLAPIQSWRAPSRLRARSLALESQLRTSTRPTLQTRRKPRNSS